MQYRELIDNLPKTKVDISDPKIRKRIRKYLPVPNDFKILWADISSYGGYPGGIVLTDRGIVIKAPKESFSVKRKSADKKKQKEAKKIGVFQIVPWEYFDPTNYEFKGWKNRAGGKSYSVFIGNSKITDYYNEHLHHFFTEAKRLLNEEDLSNAAVYSSIEYADLENTVFNATYGADNTNTGHGIYAEEAGAKLDQLHGEKATVVGRDNAKDGPDKLVQQKGSTKGIPVQCKYYKSANGSVRACFRKNAQTGKMEYRYYQLDGKTPMMVEVPKDQYNDAVRQMERRIRNGEVPGVTDPDLAKSIVRKGRITYNQARNLAKAGTVESLTYDMATGVVSCSAVAGISSVVVFAVTFWQTKDKKKAANAALEAGIQVFGPAFVGRVLAAQLARTSLPNMLVPATESFAKLLSPQTVQGIINTFRTLAGKGKIYGAAAQKSFAKALRTSVLAQVVIFGITSIPDTYRVIMGKITGAQFTKNIISSAAAIGGAFGGGVLAAKGAAHLPIPNLAIKAVSVGGAFAGGTITGIGVRTLGSLIKEDDAIINMRMINAVISIMCLDYLLSEEEVDKLIEKLNNEEKSLKELVKNTTGFDKQYKTIETSLQPYFEDIVSKREKIGTEEESEMYYNMDENLKKISEEEMKQ